jgi:hypothetical protein
VARKPAKAPARPAPKGKGKKPAGKRVEKARGDSGERPWWERTEALGDQSNLKPRGIGRPSKFDPAFCEEVIVLGMNGYEVAEIALHFGVCKDTLYQWQTDHPAFSDAFKRARVFAEAFHTRRLRLGLNFGAGDFQGGAYLKYMALRFREGPDGGWSETQNVNLNGKLDVNGAKDGLADQLAKAVAAITAAGGRAEDPAQPNG